MSSQVGWMSSELSIEESGCKFKHYHTTTNVEQT